MAEVQKALCGLKQGETKESDRIAPEDGKFDFETTVEKISAIFQMPGVFNTSESNAHFQNEGCKCSTWKSTDLETDDKVNDAVCKNCRHVHFSLSDSNASVWLNSAMQMRLRKALMNKIQPGFDDKPPFERPNIETAVRNALLLCAVTNPQKPDITIELCKLFLSYINSYKIAYPSQRSHKHENKTGYKLIYMRWLCHCYIPKFCLTLPYTEVTCAFGKNFLLAVLPEIKRKLSDFFKNNSTASSALDVKSHLIQPLMR
ncbi:unnamed protein product [Trichobilharzia regenti]|nr:unnamed protein product [Trichobilharzia regenti]